MWRNLALELFADAEFESGVDAADLDQADAALGEPLPDQLRSLLQETNGIAADGMDVIWTLDRIVNDNRMFRTSDDFSDLYLPFDGLLFFGDNACGDQFAFRLRGNLDDIFIWDHENDSRQWIAWGLQGYFSYTAIDGDDEE